MVHSYMYTARAVGDHDKTLVPIPYGFTTHRTAHTGPKHTHTHIPYCTHYGSHYATPDPERR